LCVWPRFAVRVAETLNNPHSFLVLYSTGLCMAFSVSRFVRGLSLENSTYSHPCSDVYSYNFPKDPRSLTFLGRSLTSLNRSLVSKCTLSSLFRLRVGDRSNCAHWGRCLLLVYCRIWGRAAPQAFPSCTNRCFHGDCSYFAHRSSVLLLSDLDNEQILPVEQTFIVDLLDRRRRVYS
jgi:hypothetical protein